MIYNSTPATANRRPARWLIAAGVGVALVAGAAAAAALVHNGPAATASGTPAQVALAADQTGLTTRYAFHTVDDPADPTFNQLLGINDHGHIAGYFGSGADAAHPNKGYVVVPGSTPHSFTNENFPGSVQTQVIGITNRATTVGFYVNTAGANIGFVRRNGQFTSVADPATPTRAPFNQLLGINNNGIAVGFYNDANGTSHGYTYNVLTRVFTPVTIPVAADSVVASGINDHGDVSGFYTTGKTTRGFLLDHGHLSTLQFGGRTNTQALGVNDADQVVGSFLDKAGAMHGFLWSHGRVTQVDDPHGAGGSLVNGLNNNRQLVGFYLDAAGRTHGFLAEQTR